MSVSEQGNEAEIPIKHSNVLVLVFGSHYRYAVDRVPVLPFLHDNDDDKDNDNDAIIYVFSDGGVCKVTMMMIRYLMMTPVNRILMMMTIMVIMMMCFRDGGDCRATPP